MNAPEFFQIYSSAKKLSYKIYEWVVSGRSFVRCPCEIVDRAAINVVSFPKTRFSNNYIWEAILMYDYGIVRHTWCFFPDSLINWFGPPLNFFLNINR